MGFGDSVKSLLETYSNCVSLLKSLRPPKRSKGGDDATKQDDQQVILLKSLKKDRALVERAYSSRLSETGGKLRKGDARAMSALDRILKRIRVTMRKLLRISSKEQNPMLDYESLMTLSNSSRIDAIRTIDNLSRRLGSNNSSRAAMTSTSSKSRAAPPDPSPPSPPPARRKSRSSHASSHDGRSHAPSSTKPAKSPSVADEPKSPRKRRSSTREKEEKAKPPPSKPKPATESKSPPSVLSKSPRTDAKRLPAVPDAPPRPSVSPESPTPEGKKMTVEFDTPLSPPLNEEEAVPRPRPVGVAQRLASAAQNRLSIASIATDSTKLGEIPERRLRSHYAAVGAGAEGGYNIRPLYPLKPYKVEVKERGFWGGLFGRKKEQ